MGVIVGGERNCDKRGRTKATHRVPSSVILLNSGGSEPSKLLEFSILRRPVIESRETAEGGRARATGQRMSGRGSHIRRDGDGDGSI